MSRFLMIIFYYYYASGFLFRSYALLVALRPFIAVIYVHMKANVDWVTRFLWARSCGCTMTVCPIVDPEKKQQKIRYITFCSLFAG